MEQAHRLYLLQSNISQTISPHCSPEAILVLYKSQVLPVIEYGYIMWNPHLRKDSLLLDAVQNFVLLISNRCHFSQLFILSMSYERLQCLIGYGKVYTWEYHQCTTQVWLLTRGGHRIDYLRTGEKEGGQGWNLGEPQIWLVANLMICRSHR